MGNQESLQRGGDIERMGRILIDIDGRTFQEVENSPSKGVMGKKYRSVPGMACNSE